MGTILTLIIKSKNGTHKLDKNIFMQLKLFQLFPVIYHCDTSQQ